MNVKVAQAKLATAVTGGWIDTDSLELAATLCTFGFSPRKVPVSRTARRDQAEKVTWWIRYETISHTGFKFRDIFLAWADSDTLPPEHAFHQVKKYASIHAGLAQSWRVAPQISFAETMRREATAYSIKVINTKLAAALLAADYAKDDREPITRTDIQGRATTCYWFILSEAQRGGVLKLVESWERFAEFEAANPEHPLCYHRAYGENREGLLRLYKDSMPQVLIHRGARSLLVTAEILPKYKRALERML